jgi:hypothetical protein
VSFTTLALGIWTMVSAVLVEIGPVRTAYRGAINSSSKADELVKLAGQRKENALFKAYYGTGKALQAKHGWNPMSRYTLAKEAAAELNSAVIAESKNLEIRFLRFSFEANAPSLLGLTLHTTDDKKWILSHLDKNHAMWDVMKTFLNSCSLLTAEEKKKLI